MADGIINLCIFVAFHTTENYLCHQINRPKFYTEIMYLSVNYDEIIIISLYCCVGRNSCPSKIIAFQETPVVLVCH